MTAEVVDFQEAAVIDGRYNAIFSQLLSPWATFCRRYAANYRRLPSGETRC